MADGTTSQQAGARGFSRCSLPAGPLWRSLFRLSVGAIAVLLADPVQALLVSPLSLTRKRGTVQVLNNSDRVLQVRLRLYPAITNPDGKLRPGSEPFDEVQAQSLIRYRPSSFRLSPSSTKSVRYTLLPEGASRSFFLCTESLQGYVNLRICSRWQPSAVSN